MMNNFEEFQNQAEISGFSEEDAKILASVGDYIVRTPSLVAPYMSLLTKMGTSTLRTQWIFMELVKAYYREKLKGIK